MLHADLGFPLNVGERVTVGHQAVLHGCACVWVGDGFAKPHEVAFDASPTYHPYICSVQSALSSRSLS